VDKDYIFQDSPLAAQWLELFRAGNYGDKGNFSNDDLDQMVANFDPSYHEPPAVIGHPEQDSPAYAWLEDLKRSGNTLLGKLKQVDPQFEEMVKAGRFKKRSLSLYQTAKGWMVRHVGFLGAKPPEVKGLANPAFKEGRSYVVEMSFSESQSPAVTAISRLKARGSWLNEFDRIGVPVLFSLLETSPALDRVVNFIEQYMEEAAQTIAPRSHVCVNMESAHMTKRACELSRMRGVSFGEALDQVAAQDGQAASRRFIAANARGLGVNMNSVRYLNMPMNLHNLKGSVSERR
jgi:hypothetical protein